MLDRLKWFYASKTQRRISFFGAGSLILVFLYEVLIFGSWYPLQKLINLLDSQNGDWVIWMIWLSVIFIGQRFLFLALEWFRYMFSLEVNSFFQIRGIEDQAMNAIAPHTHVGQSEQIAQFRLLESSSLAASAGILQALPSIVRLTSLMAVFFYFSTEHGVVLSFFILLAVALMLLFSRPMKKMVDEAMLDKLDFQIAQNRRIEEYPIKYILGVEQDGAQDVVRASKRLVYAERWRHFKWNLIGLSLQLVSALAKVCLFILSALLFEQQSITIGMLYAMFSWSTMSEQYTNDLQSLGLVFMEGKASYEKVKKALSVSMSSPSLNLWPENREGNISLKNVSVTYSDGNKTVLNEINFALPIGTCIVLYSPSGGGKTTMLRLLEGACQYEGSVMVDGVELRDINSVEYRRQYLSAVLQELNLFHGSILENIQIANVGSTKEEVESILQKVGFNLPGDSKLSLDFQVGERGQKLSGGQRQRISLARAFIRDKAKLLLIDEPTSALDDLSAEKVILELARLAQIGNKTIVIATHDQRFRSAPGFRVVELKNGQIVE